MPRETDPVNSTPSLASIDDAELVGALRRVGLDVPEELAREILRRGPAVVPLLSEILLDREAWERELGSWAAVHAFYLLGGIGARGGEGAIEAVMRLIRLDLGWRSVVDDSPAVLASFGPAAIEPLAELLADRTVRGTLRGPIAVSALVQIGHDHPSERPRIVPLLLEALAGSDPVTVGYAVSRMAAVDDPQVLEAIDAVFAAGAVSLEIIIRENVHSVRAESPPWRSPRAARDPMLHFTQRNLAYLKSFSPEPEPERGPATRPDHSPRRQGKKRTNKGKKKGKRRR